jgi:tRNA uridine 5-carbamoylmethylation protein Kti12
MPLILIVGRPSSGKTRRALKLKEYIETELSQEVVILNEEMLKMNRNECYSGRPC